MEGYIIDGTSARIINFPTVEKTLEVVEKPEKKGNYKKNYKVGEKQEVYPFHAQSNPISSPYAFLMSSSLIFSLKRSSYFPVTFPILFKNHSRISWLLSLVFESTEIQKVFTLCL